ncbi:response regulator transcription factor [Raoultibacter phocaeensis]|uniref:response regulator transcription factor n=1 Tax=Raoultibacter phocaeensis TaxID=2479841 RepID=UPI0015D5C6B8|nr:LuxR C-terminal-related transcriptional regulator [Raoultibacter phocaeensis]
MEDVSISHVPDLEQTEKKTREKKNEWLFVNPYLIAGIAGASFCFSWFFSILLTPDFLYSHLADTRVDQLLHIAFAAVLFITYLIVWRLSGFFQRHRGFLLVIALVCGLISAFPVVWPGFLQDAVLPVRTACAGIGVASLATLWVEFLCVHLKEQVRVAIASIFVLSFVWYAGVLLVDERYSPFVVVAFVLVSCGVYYFLRKNFALMDAMPAIEARESDSRLLITWKPSLLTVMGSVAQGFVLYWLLQAEAHASATSFLLEGVSLVVVVLLLVDSLKSFTIKESFIRKLFLPVLAACILALLFIPAEWRYVPCLLAFGFSLLPYSSAIFATCEHIVRCRLSAIRAFSWARLYASIGLLIGLGAGWLAFSSKVFGDVTLPVLIVIIVMFFILVSTTLSTKSYYPGEDEEGERIARIGQNGEILFELVEHQADHPGDGKKYFQQKCDAIARIYGLTNRQTEVLHLLAKGRNAAYIQKQLVISQHTAKAHIYSIYKKTETHSQQDLMDLVEAYELYEG